MIPSDATVDTHVHFWDRNVHRHPWLERPQFAGLPVVAGWAEFGPVAGRIVLVEAGADAGGDTPWLSEIAMADPRVAGVVVAFDGALPLRGREHGVVGHRLQVQRMSEPTALRRPAVRDAARALGDADLTTELVLRADQRRDLPWFAERVGGRVVVDHLAAPPSAADLPSWRGVMTELRGASNVWIKVSGHGDAVRDPGRGDGFVDDVLAHLAETVGPERILWGSDWPVCLARGAGSYAEEVGSAADRLDRVLGAETAQRVLAETAETAYALGRPRASRDRSDSRLDPDGSR